MSDEKEPVAPSTELPDWTKGKKVCSIAEAAEETTVLETEMDSTIPSLEFSWFAVKASAGNSNIEEQEKLVAIKEQIALGIINPDGSPTSSKKKDKAPEPVKQPGGKLARKALRMREKSIVKDMAKQQKQMNKMVLLKNQAPQNASNSTILNNITNTETKND